MTRVVVTGAAGGVGTMLVPGLRERFDVVATDRTAAPGIEVLDVGETDAVRRMLDGADALVHLAGAANPGAPWDELRRGNVDPVVPLLEEARRAGVARIVLTSSVHALGAELDDGATTIAGDAPVRPCCAYGATKAMAESLADVWVRQWDLSIVSLRLGAAARAPRGTSWLGPWIGPDDLVRLYVAARESDATGAYVGTSSNSGSPWDLSATSAALGYAPHDDSARFADVPDDSDVPHGTGPRWGLLHRS